MKQSIKEIIITLCCSYTIVVAVNVFFGGQEYMMSIGAYELRQTFWLCLVTAIVINLILNISYSKPWMSYVASLITMFVSVFGVGTFVLHLIPLRADVYLSVSIMSSFIYLLCSAIGYAIEKTQAEEINEKLNQKFKNQKENHRE